jgi:hypothetical protein
MEGAERDSTQEWLLPESKAPPRLGDLDRKVDEALVIARASEEGLRMVGRLALDAAEQARRAAELAETASAAAVAAGRAVAFDRGVAADSATTAAPPDSYPAQAAAPAPSIDLGAAPIGNGEDLRLRDFTERADRVSARLLALEGGRVRSPTAAAAAQPPGG